MKQNTVDIAVTIAGRDLVLIERTKPPFEDKLCLPGGRIEPEDPTPADAAVREAFEEIGLALDPAALRFVTMLTGDRDPRPDVGDSTVFHVDFAEVPALQAGSDAKRLIIRALDSLRPEEMGFDHWEVIMLLTGVKTDNASGV
jgi:ADP-ribose pyrophosphatase YjhB (NUDIX family)